jgi:hypothetical protein
MQNQLNNLSAISNKKPRSQSPENLVKNKKTGNKECLMAKYNIV